ncbi:Transmembrane protein like [Melia azedarach]|uniref:Transmembrane protein like n=1 Tax=Melia azedarach TaxID=155640 RepID=A0ACC1YFN0_MELAZ|nr:Transmembrane protein like [Melia azedarach]
MGEAVPFYFSFIAFLCTVGATGLGIFHVYRHLLNYTEPTYQRYIVRIILMVPLFAIMSFLSLILRDSAIYFNSIREVYEAWVIYNFLSLCLAWVGGPWSGCAKFKWSGPKAIFVSDDVLLPSNTSGWAFHKEMQARLFAVCDFKAYLGCCYLNTLCKGEI